MQRNFSLIPPKPKRANRLKAKPTGRRTDDPTPTEILIRCAEIQAEWSAEEEYRHRVCKAGQYGIDTPVSTANLPQKRLRE